MRRLRHRHPTDTQPTPNRHPTNTGDERECGPCSVIADGEAGGAGGGGGHSMEDLGSEAQGVEKGDVTVPQVCRVGSVVVKRTPMFRKFQWSPEGTRRGWQEHRHGQRASQESSRSSETELKLGDRIHREPRPRRPPPAHWPTGPPPATGKNPARCTAVYPTKMT